MFRGTYPHDILAIPYLDDNGTALSESARTALMRDKLKDPSLIDGNGYLTIPFSTSTSELAVVDVAFGGQKYLEPELYKSYRLRDLPYANTSWKPVFIQKDEPVNLDVNLQSMVEAAAHPEAPVRLRTTKGSSVMLRGAWLLSGEPREDEDRQIRVLLTEPGTPYRVGGGVLIALGIPNVALAFPLSVGVAFGGGSQTQVTLAGSLTAAAGLAAIIGGIVLVVQGHALNREAMVPQGGYDAGR